MADDLTVTARLRDELSAGLDRVRGKIKDVGSEAERTGGIVGRASGGFDKLAGVAGRAGIAAAKGIGLASAAASVFAVKVGIDAVKAASDLQQASGGIDAVFKGQAKTMHANAKAAATSAGLTAAEYSRLGTLIGSQLKNGGTSMDQLAGKTDGLIKTGSDLAAMYGGTTSDAVAALSSALKGEMDPIEQYGISLNDSALKAEAAALGIKTVGGNLDQAGKQAAVMSLIMKQSGDATGAFGREANTLAGQQERLKAKLGNTSAAIGTALLPAMTGLVTKASDIVDRVGPALEGWATRFAENIGGVVVAWDLFKDDLDGGESLAMQVAAALSLPPEVAGPLGTFLDTFKVAVTDAGTVITAVLAPALTNVLTLLPGWASPLGLITGGLSLLASNAGIAAPALTALLIVMGLARAATAAATAVTIAKNAADAVSLGLLMARTPGTLAYALATGVASAASGVWTAAQWLLNAALTANPIGLVIALVAGLAAGIYVAYQKSATFRGIVDKVWQAIKTLGTWIGNAVVKFAEMVSKSDVVRGSVMGLQIAFDGLKSAIGWVLDKAQALWEKLSSLKNISLPSFDLPFGDTATSRAHGRGDIGSTLGAVGAAARASGARATVTNAFVGGGGHGGGSGDHQAGRAVDLVGSGLNGLAAKIKGAGGYAAWHGSGGARHLHAVPAPIGDTATSRVSLVRRRSSGSGSVLNVGTINVDARGADRSIDVKAAVLEALEEARREQEERA